ncbi:hypothetical protein [uncultured Lactobacillus sp.]|uniref:hypothetical protein n=1 Tax=uncultured Lactobacillus sp. TaxID=153152 RepID=UPI002805BEA6|nr:hypothetical protein [uncultured Lactobacillus sp.]
MSEETKKYFTLSNSDNGQITSQTDLDLINRKDETVWVMNHIFLNPDEHDPHELSLLMNQVIKYVQESNKKVWPLDPIAIKYFEKHPELNEIWYHKPFSNQ